MNDNLEKRVYILCPVRNRTTKERLFLLGYVSHLESEGYIVHYPERDTNQTDPTGMNIASENKEAIRNADEIHVYWSATSTGSIFDLGMTFMAGKPVKIINKDSVKRTPEKSFKNLLLELHDRYS